MNDIFSGSLSRRDLAQDCFLRFWLPGAGELVRSAAASESPNPLAAKSPHFKPRAKRVIFLFMGGAPSHVDTFDYKPRLQADDGKTAEGNGQGTQTDELALQIQPARPERPVVPGDFSQSGRPRRRLVPAQQHVYRRRGPSAGDDRNCTPASSAFVRPSMGAWVLYGLGTENTELPGFITINPPGGAQSYGSAFLPASFQGTKIDGVQERSGGGADREHRQSRNSRPNCSANSSTCWRASTASGSQKDRVNPELEGRDRVLRTGIPHGRGRAGGHGPLERDRGDSPGLRHRRPRGPTISAGSACWRGGSPKRGVRFIELGFDGWDQHSDLKAKLTTNAHSIDKPIAALLADLEAARHAQGHARRVGRRVRPHAGGSEGNDGRDHNTKRLLDVDGRRRRQRGLPSRRHRRARRTRGGKQGCTSTTCTPRCSTCSAWITPG